MCITLDVMPADVTVEYILDYISETGRDMHHCQKVSRLTCSVFLHKFLRVLFEDNVRGVMYCRSTLQEAVPV